MMGIIHTTSGLILIEIFPQFLFFAMFSNIAFVFLVCLCSVPYSISSSSCR